MIQDEGSCPKNVNFLRFDAMVSLIWAVKALPTLGPQIPLRKLAIVSRMPDASLNAYRNLHLRGLTAAHIRTVHRYGETMEYSLRSGYPQKVPHSHHTFQRRHEDN